MKARTTLATAFRRASLSSTSRAAAVRSTTASGSQVYESRRAVDEYLLFHYGDASDVMPYAFGPAAALDFPRRLAELVCIADSGGGGKRGRALDIGCSVGGSAFELARHYEHVVGIDFSQHFVDAANDMKHNGTRSFEVLKQGQLFLPRQATVPSGIDRSRVSFQQGDACHLDAGALGTFNAILASNLLCRLPSPRLFIDRVATLLRPGGVLVLVSPYSWLDEYTPRAEWFGAKVDAATGQSQDSFRALQAYIQTQKIPLALKSQEDVPFLIREHERKFQYGVSDCTVWQRT